MLRKIIAVCFCHLFLLGIIGCDSSSEIDMEKREKVIVGQPPPHQQSLHIAVGAMITPKEGFVYYRDFLDYIGDELGVNVEFVDKDSYAEINNLLMAGEIDAAFVCSGPYVDGRKDFGLEPLVAPQAYGESVYYSYIIVPVDSQVERFDQLKDKKFAFADPQSNTGTLVPTYMLARRNETPDSFFEEYIFTYAHDKSIKAVAQKVVDGAAVDSLIWEYAHKTNPEFTSKTKIIEKSPPYGIPPVVVRPGIDAKLRERLKTVFLNAHKNERGRKLLAGMMIEKFVEIDDRLYDPVREMKKWVAERNVGE